MTETIANGYSSESTHQELSNKYLHDRVKMVFTNLCILLLWTRVASALEVLKSWLSLVEQNRPALKDDRNDVSIGNHITCSLIDCYF